MTADFLVKSFSCRAVICFVRISAVYYSEVMYCRLIFLVNISSQTWCTFNDMCFELCDYFLLWRGSDRLCCPGGFSLADMVFVSSMFARDFLDVRSLFILRPIFADGISPKHIFWSMSLLRCSWTGIYTQLLHSKSPSSFSIFFSNISGFPWWLLRISLITSSFPYLLPSLYLRQRLENFHSVFFLERNGIVRCSGYVSQDHLFKVQVSFILYVKLPVQYSNGVCHIRPFL